MSKLNETFCSRLTRWVGRLLKFEFSVVCTPEKTLGVADYLYSEILLHMAGILLEQMFNDWFTINVVEELAKELNGTIRSKVQQPMRIEIKCDSESKATKYLLTVIDKNASETQNKITIRCDNTNKPCGLPNMAESCAEPSESRISKIYAQANYEKDRHLQNNG